MGPLSLEIPDVAKGDALTNKSKVLYDKSNVYDVGIKTSDLGYGGSGLSGWSRSALLDELHSSDVTGNKHVDPALVNLLKVSFTRSNFSMAFPYVALSEEETVETLLVSGFKEACGHGLEVSSVAFSESCSIEGGDFQKLANLHSIHDHLVSRMDKRTKWYTDLLVLCHGGSHSVEELDQPYPESEIMNEVIASVEQSGAKYAGLSVSYPFKSMYYPGYRELERILAEGNASANSAGCVEVCEIKSSLLEGVLVGIVLLFILISGLCCMMGIDTPTRFEAPQDN